MCVRVCACFASSRTCNYRLNAKANVGVNATFFWPSFQSSPGVCCPPWRTSSPTSWAWAENTRWRWRTRPPSSWQHGAARSSRTWGRSLAEWRHTRLLGTRATARWRRKTCCWTCTGELTVSDFTLPLCTFRMLAVSALPHGLTPPLPPRRSLEQYVSESSKVVELERTVNETSWWGAPRPRPLPHLAKGSVSWSKPHSPPPLLRGFLQALRYTGIMVIILLGGRRGEGGYWLPPSQKQVALIHLTPVNS